MCAVTVLLDAGELQQAGLLATLWSQNLTFFALLLCVTPLFVSHPHSERLDRSMVEDMRKREACSINQSLSALGDVFAALSSKTSHIPYRNSKLTYLLQVGRMGLVQWALYPPAATEEP
jgi:hypothetical protein